MSSFLPAHLAFCPRNLSPSPRGVTAPRAGRSRVKHQLPQPVACPIPACRAAPRCLAPAPPGGPAASSASSAETGERGSRQSSVATRTRKLQCCPHWFCPRGLGGQCFLPAGCYCQGESPRVAGEGGNLAVSTVTQRGCLCWAALSAGDLWMGVTPQITFCSPVTEVWSEPCLGDPGGCHTERLISHYGSSVSRPIIHCQQAPVRHCHPPRSPVHHAKSFLPSPPL